MGGVILFCKLIKGNQSKLLVAVIRSSVSSGFTILALLLCCLEINKYLNPSRTVAAMASGWDLRHPHAVDATRVPLRTY